VGVFLPTLLTGISFFARDEFIEFRASDRGHATGFCDTENHPRPSSVVRITGIAFGWIGFTTALATVVRKPWN
jgi:hypothetical protein